MLNWFNKKHKHIWIDSREFYSVNSAWIQIEQKCECGATQNKTGRPVKAWHKAIPKHDHEDRRHWENTDYVPGRLVAFCENCNGHYKFRKDFYCSDFWLQCPSCETGAWLIFYYSPCCVDALNSVLKPWVQKK